MKRILSSFLISGFFLFIFVPQVLAATETWNPAKTYALIVGVLDWQDPGMTSFPTRNRKDQELYDTLAQRGVPRSNRVLLLDQQATLTNIRAALKRLSSQASKDATFFFYYAGHGLMRPGGKVFLANYDIQSNNPVGSGLAVDAVYDDLRQYFKGKRVILTADHCYSGALKEVASRLYREKQIAAVSLTSAESSNISTGNWTFSQTLLDGLRGDPLSDHNQDGSVSLGELSKEVASAMKYREKQRSGFAPYGIPPSFSLAKVNNPPQGKKALGNFSVGDYVEVQAPNEKKKTARILEAGPASYRVQFYGYSDKNNRWVPDKWVQPISYKNYPVGKDVQVEWGGKLWAAKILKVEGDFHWITYPGWDHYWDEWVMADRIHTAESGAKAEKKAQVEWQGKWYPAVILKQKGGRYYIHYLGYDSGWDEWVGPARLRMESLEKN